MSVLSPSLIDEIATLEKTYKKLTTTSSNTSPSAGLLLKKLHLGFLARLVDKKRDKNTLEYVATEHLRIQGMFWALGAMHLLGHLSALYTSLKEELVAFVWACFDQESGGFGGNIHHDPHMLHTQHAVYVLFLLEAPVDEDQRDRILGYVQGLQNPDGSFKGDKWGESDSRFSYSAVTVFSLFKHSFDKEVIIQNIFKCQNTFDHGFGSRPNGESHAGYVFTCLGTLSVLGALDRLPYR